MGKGQRAEAEVESQHAGEVHERGSLQPGKEGAGYGTEHAAYAVAGMHHGNAGAEEGALYLYGLRIHGDIDEAHGEADRDAGEAQL